jgi:SNF2 family DNA or RNA helicase
VRTYGSLVYGHSNDSPTFALRTEPHVMIRLKRLFPRAQGSRTGHLFIRATPEVARDLEWILDRWPLDVTPVARDQISSLAGRHRQTEDAVLHILEGHRRSLHLQREPARPGRDYQIQAADMLLATRRLLLADEVGLGKTQSAILTFLDPDTLPAVFVTLTHLPVQMQREIATVTPWLTTHVAKRGTPYDVDTDILIISYSKLAGWVEHLSKADLGLVVFDEIQELRRNGTNRYIAAARIADQARYRLGLSATPVYNYGDEAHNVFSILAPDLLGDRSEFLREWGGRSTYGGNTLVSDPTALGAYLRDQGLMLRRTRADVGRQLPDVVRVTQPVDADLSKLDEVQVEVEDLARRLIDGPSDERFQAAGEMEWKLRKATGEAKAPYVAAFVRMLLDSEPKIVLYGWHRDVYDRWLTLLAEFQPRLYTGTENPRQKQLAADAFIDGDSRLLIVSLRSGAGLDGLQKAARVCVFGELDWSPGIHHQCEGRLHRDGQPDPVVAYYLTADVGSDPTVMEVLGVKRGQAEPMLDPNIKTVAVPDQSAARMRRLAESYLDRQRRHPSQAALA